MVIVEMRVNFMSKKKIWIVLGIILVAIVCVGAFFVIRDLKQEEALEDEMDRIYDMMDRQTIDSEGVRVLLTRTISKGEYLSVEKALKEYLLDVLDTYDEAIALLEDEQLTNLLTVDNYEEDGPDFKRSKEYITKTEASLTELKDQFKNYLKSSTILSYIEKENLESYYVEFYKELALDDNDDFEDTEKVLDESIDEILAFLKDCDRVFDFLIQNKGKWSIKDGTLYLQNDALTIQYNRLIDNTMD